MKIGRAGFRKAVKVGEENALEILVDLFDWLDALEPWPTTEIIPLYVKPLRTLTHAWTKRWPRRSIQP